MNQGIPYRFHDTYRCLSSATVGRPELEEGGRILLPEDALNSIYNSGYDNSRGIMLFCIKNIHRGTVAYAGVENFTMPPGQVCLPYWLMEFLQCRENDIVNVSLTTLRPAKKAVFQPLSSNFYQIPNPGVVLEYTLRAHPCLTQGTIIIIKFNNRTYKLKVLKTEPDTQVQIFKNDVVCEFAPAIDEFKHHWNEPDVDSSDEEIIPQVRKGKTLSGKVIEETEELKPLHSTFAQRENDRLHGNVFRTKEIVQGQEILPPKPPERSRDKEKKTQYLEGQGHIIKKKKAKKGAKQDPSPPPPPPQQQQPAPPKIEPTNAKTNTINKSYFTGVAHNVKGESIQAPPVQPMQPPPQQQQQQDEKKEQQTKSYFSGPSRTLKSPSTPAQQTQPPPQQKQQPQPTQNTNTTQKKSFFDGPSRKIKQ